MCIAFALGRALRLPFACTQEMTLDEYEAMLAEKNPKTSKDAPKAKVPQFVPAAGPLPCSPPDVACS